LPLVLYEQFRKFTSFYFLIVCIICFIPAVSPVSPWSTLPGLLFILFVAMVREAVEDFFRFKSDLRENMRKYHVIQAHTGQEVKTRCRDLRVGDLVKIERNRIIPADVVIVGSALEEGVGYIETAQLDGETNLKLRRCPDATQGLRPEELAQLEGRVECGVPVSSIYAFKGAMHVTSVPASSGAPPVPSSPAVSGKDFLTDDEHRQSASVLGFVQESSSGSQHQGLIREESFDGAESAIALETTMRSHNSRKGRRKQEQHGSLIRFDTKSRGRVQEPMTCALDEDHMLPRGTVLRNTPWIVGLVVYAGVETKISLNTKKPPSKFSSLDYRMNKYVLGIFFFQIVLITGCAVFAGKYEVNDASNMWYLGDVGDSSTFLVSIQSFFSYFVIMSYLIPLSLVVSLEVVKVCQARFMEWDYFLRHDNKRMVVKTSNLNDELGLVEYVFSDKTGTLTQNVMNFMMASVRGRRIDGRDGGLWRALEMASSDKEAAEVHDFLLCMSTCHNVVTEKDENGDLVYKASSPDEEAICRGAKENLFAFQDQSSSHILVHINGEIFEAEVLCSMPFSSERKRMSVILRMPDGRIRLFSKGADSAMLERLSSRETKEIIHREEELLEEFSAAGLRTLLLCAKDLTKEEYKEFAEKYHKASTTIENKDELVEEVNDAMERDFFILGATAIEDRLQDNVPETIAYLIAAGIKVWVITGDKQTTAVNIGYSTRLLNRDMDVVIINSSEEEELRQMLHDALAKYEPDVGDNNRGYQLVTSDDEEENSCGHSSEGKVPALVIDGKTLKIALDQFPSEFVRFGKLCKSVICCRVDPKQKAQIVQTVQEEENITSLAIGDGGNDVSMIQQAHIGVGIFGREGSQAARSSDYAVHQFSHLQRLLTVHGRYSLVRNALLTHYSFYKNASIFLVQIWFSFYAGCSGQSLYDDWVMTFFNIYITALPPLMIGCFEKDISDKLIAKYPKTYYHVQRNKIFTLKSLCIWMSSAMYHSLVLFFGAYFVFYNNAVQANGQEGTGLREMGVWVIFVGMIVIFAKLYFVVVTWNVYILGSVILSWFLFFFTVLIEDQTAYFFPDQYNVMTKSLASPSFWLWMLVTIVVCLLPDFIATYVQRQYFPYDWMILQEHEKKTAKNRLPSAESKFLLAADLERRSHQVNTKTYSSSESDLSDEEP